MTSIAGLPNNNLTNSHSTSNCSHSSTAASNNQNQGLAALIAEIEALIAQLTSQSQPGPAGNMHSCACSTPMPKTDMSSFMSNLSSELNSVTNSMGNLNSNSGPIVSDNNEAPEFSLLESPLTGGASNLRIGLGSSFNNS